MNKVTVDNLLPLVELREEELSSTDYYDDEIGPGKKITLHFSLAFASDGAVIDSNFEKSPACFCIGDGNFLPGFEKVLLGMKQGNKKTIVLPCRQAFGELNNDNFQTYPRYQFPAELLIEKGLMISFSDAAGNEQAAVVSEYDSDNVIMDFNHPLAGKSIEFRVEILNIETITTL